jgi:hypothetical protein
LRWENWQRLDARSVRFGIAAKAREVSATRLILDLRTVRVD